jgi:hypothetical protein
MVVFTSGIIDIPLSGSVLVRMSWAGWSAVCRVVGVRWVGAHCWGSEESDPCPCRGGCLSGAVGVQLVVPGVAAGGGGGGL